MIVYKQVWAPLPSLLHHTLSVINHVLFLHLIVGDLIHIPKSSCQGCVPCTSPRVGMAVLRGVLAVESFSFQSQRMIEEPWQQFREVHVLCLGQTLINEMAPALNLLREAVCGRYIVYLGINCLQ